MESSIIKIARKAIDIESDALDELEEYIDENFEKAIELLSKIKGKIVITGVGKSGQVGLKIASTLASTGSPSFFMHPADASHGDLGMVSEDDAIITISNGGESKELNNIYEYAKRFSIPLIGITSGKDSTMARYVDIPLFIPKTHESCPIGRAPTTSALVTLAMGDAITVGLAYVKGLTEEVYKNWHPGGKIGSSLLKVREIMHSGSELPLISNTSSVMDALKLLRHDDRNFRFGCVGITDENANLVGILTEGDFNERLKSDPEAKFLKEKCENIMIKNPKSIKPDQLATEALNIMDNYNIKVMFVVDDSKKPVGIIQLYDLLAAGVI
jgi:arabinose-5-phosphate isomerase